MFDIAWWLGLGAGTDPRETVARLQKAVSNYRKYVVMAIALGGGIALLMASAGPRGWWWLFNVGVPWALAAILVLLPSSVVEVKRWSPRTRRLVLAIIGVATVWLIMFAGWHMLLYDRSSRSRDAFGPLVPLAVSGLLLWGLAWSTLAGAYLRKHGRCACPPPIKRWMRTAPVPRSAFGPHRCPARPVEQLAA